MTPPSPYRAFPCLPIPCLVSSAGCGATQLLSSYFFFFLLRWQIVRGFWLPTYFHDGHQHSMERESLVNNSPFQYSLQELWHAIYNCPSFLRDSIFPRQARYTTSFTSPYHPSNNKRKALLRGRGRRRRGMVHDDWVDANPLKKESNLKLKKNHPHPSDRLPIRGYWVWLPLFRWFPWFNSPQHLLNKASKQEREREGKRL